jgi:hypothetical protein
MRSFQQTITYDLNLKNKGFKKWSSKKTKVVSINGDIVFAAKFTNIIFPNARALKLLVEC